MSYYFLLSNLHDKIIISSSLLEAYVEVCFSNHLTKKGNYPKNNENVT